MAFGFPCLTKKKVSSFRLFLSRRFFKPAPRGLRAGHVAGAPAPAPGRPRRRRRRHGPSQPLGGGAAAGTWKGGWGAWLGAAEAAASSFLELVEPLVKKIEKKERKEASPEENHSHFRGPT